MSEITRTDVTSVKIHNKYILAGIGSSINIFEKESLKFLQKYHVLLGQKIYSFVPSKCDSKILVFGGKQFTVVCMQSNNEYSKDHRGISRLFLPVVADDWLHSGVWINDTIVALLTAHNVVQKWDTSTCTLISQQSSKDNSILYSGLLVAIDHDILVMAGTVFSEVIVHRSGDEGPLHHLRGHKGVIFSISCDVHKGMIVTTSDDRSVRIWGPNITSSFAANILDYWKNIDLVCKHEMYGHFARVMRNCITNTFIISVGEDSAICFWDHEGNLIKKNVSHQNGCIWSVDADNDHIVTGGGDCALIIHSLKVATDYCQNEILNLDIGTPKNVVFTARRNIVILNDGGDLIHYDVVEKYVTVQKLKHQSTYKLLSVSSCKQMIAVADMMGKLDVFMENCKDKAFILNIIDTKLHIGKILSMQWAGNRHLVLCSENGLINILAYKNSYTEIYDNFVLPSCKERWVTASAINITNNIFVLGDRCGNIHLYSKGKRDPIKSFSKVHGRYGPTSINIRENSIITTGRDGSIKYFDMNTDLNDFKYMNSKDIQFQWVEKFLDKDESLICGFQERVFVVYDIRNNSKVLEVPCGGGHRSWDALRYIDKVNEIYEECIRLVYVKNSDLHLSTFELSKIVSRNMINGSHSKEINCLKVYQSEIDNSVSFFISGGEDTTLRISSIDNNLKFRDEVVFKQLSSIRTLKVLTMGDNKIILISAGGRAQICVKNITFTKANNVIKISPHEVINYLIKGTDKERKGNQNWRNCLIDFDPETRIMDIDVINNDNDYIIFAGCSDACFRIFTFDNIHSTFKTITELKYHKTCILKTHHIKILNNNILLTCTTRGDVAFWNVTDIATLSNLEPFFITKSNKSGINSVASKVIDNKLLIATGGDDNTIHLNFLEILEQNNLNSIKTVHNWSSDKYHSSQITGLCLIDDLIISASVDQRITLLRWRIKDFIECDFLYQIYTDIADVQGMDLVENSDDSLKVCVFGKGMEIVKLSKTRK